MFLVWAGLGMGSDGEPEVILVVVNGTVGFVFGVFGLHSCFSLVVSS